MTKTNKEQLSSKMRELSAAMSQMEYGSTEYNEAQAKFDSLKREYQVSNLDDAAHEHATKGQSEQGKAFREYLRERKPGSKFELKRETVAGMAMADTTAVTPNYLQAVLDQPEPKSVYRLAGCPVVHGATGINDWAYAGSATVKIQNELTKYGDASTIDLTKTSATQQRIQSRIIISNQAIENEATDLVALAQRKIATSYEGAINFAACSTAKWGANFYGGFAHANKQTYQYTSTGFTFADAMAMVALVANKDFDVANGAFVMGPTDFYALKATPKDAGSGLMVIDDNNRLGGFPVFVTTDINRATLKGTVSGANIGFGLFNNLPCLQHGNVRLSIDAASAEAADVDGVIITCNADWSMTDLFPETFVLGTKKA